MVLTRQSSAQSVSLAVTAQAKSPALIMETLCCIGDDAFTLKTLTITPHDWAVEFCVLLRRISSPILNNLKTHRLEPIGDEVFTHCHLLTLFLPVCYCALGANFPFPVSTSKVSSNNDAMCRVISLFTKDSLHKDASRDAQMFISFHDLSLMCNDHQELPFEGPPCWSDGRGGIDLPGISNSLKPLSPMTFGINTRVAIRKPSLVLMILA